MQEVKEMWRGVQTRPGGWFKVPRDADPVGTVTMLADTVVALSARVDELEAAAVAKPAPNPKRTRRKRGPSDGE